MLQIPPAQDKASSFNIYTHPAMWLSGLAMFCTFFNAYGMYAFLGGDYLYSIGLGPREVGSLVFFLMVPLALFPHRLAAISLI